MLERLAGYLKLAERIAPEPLDDAGQRSCAFPIVNLENVEDGAVSHLKSCDPFTSRCSLMGKLKGHRGERVILLPLLVAIFVFGF